MGRGSQDKTERRHLQRRGASATPGAEKDVSYVEGIAAYLDSVGRPAPLGELTIALTSMRNGPVLRHSVRSAIYQNMDGAGRNLFTRAGDGIYALQGAGRATAAASSRASVSKEAKQLADYDRYVMPLWTRFSQAATGKGSQEDGNQARARAVRNLPVPTQVKLIQIAQGCREITEALALTVACPTCHSKVREPCATMQTAEQADLDKKKYRKVSHPDRLALAQQRSRSKSALATVARAQSIGAKAREIFIFSHTGYVMQRVRPYIGSFDSESAESAMLVLRQEAYQGLNDAIDFYDPHYADVSPADQAAQALLQKKREKANPLTYAANKIRDRVSTAIELGPLVTAKSRAYDERQRVQAASKAIENQGKVASIEEVAKVTDIPATRVAQLMRSLASISRLDAPMKSDESTEELGSVIADNAPSTEDRTVGGAERDAVREAAKALAPFPRRVVELGFELTDGEDVEQKDLYDGVYVDLSTGEHLSAEGTVISDRRKRGETVVKASQKDLNRRFRDGELVFEAGTPESFELALLKAQGDGKEKLPEPTRKERLARRITNATGIPMTSGQIQDAKDNALFELSRDPKLQDLRPRYRGDHELEQSLQARQMVRRALVITGKLSQAEADSVKAGRSAHDGSHARGPLVKLAEEQGWISQTSGRVNWRQLREDVASHKTEIMRQRRRPDATDEDVDFAALMSAV